MGEKIEVEAPTVYCPKEKREVPIRFCVGSFVQNKKACVYCEKAEISIANNYAKVKCSYKVHERKKDG